MKNHSIEFSIEKMAKVLDVSTSGYYDYFSRILSNQKKENLFLLEKINESFLLSLYTYGSPRIYQDLKDQGIHVGENRIAKLMKDNKISPLKAKTFRVCTTDSNHSFSIFPNKLNQNFDIGELGKTYVSDITYIEIVGGYSYLTTVMDIGRARLKSR